MNVTEEKHDVLCQCGWGRLSIPKSEIPEKCPVCGFNFWEHAEHQGDISSEDINFEEES